MIAITANGLDTRIGQWVLKRITEPWARRRQRTGPQIGHTMAWLAYFVSFAGQWAPGDWWLVAWAYSLVAWHYTRKIAKLSKPLGESADTAPVAIVATVLKLGHQRAMATASSAGVAVILLLLRGPIWMPIFVLSMAASGLSVYASTTMGEPPAKRRAHGLAFGGAS